MTFLDIIIPQYKEDDNLVSKLLDSIRRQKKVKFEEIGIIIINDASDVELDINLFKKYKPLNIKYIKNEVNSGPGVTRQNGLKASKAKYVTFVDADDELYGDDSLYQVINSLKQTNCNILCTTMLQEKKVGNEIKIVAVPFDNMRTLHGLFIKRRYLADNEISFHPSLRYYEDSYFIMTLIHDNNYVNVDKITYVWKYNENSLTLGGNNSICVNHFMDLYTSVKDIYDYYKKHNVKNSNVYLFQQIIEMSLILFSSLFENSKLDSNRATYEKLVWELYINNQDEINMISSFNKERIIKYQTNDVLNYYKGIELKGTFGDFIKKMESK